MITLGIELSSRQGSAALLRNGGLLAEKTWIGEKVRHGVLFQTLKDLLNESGVSYSEISLYAVGRGPGSFSGMRMSLAVAQALALPGKTEVRAVSSGAALALQAARSLLPDQRRIAVVGDARRGQCWMGVFDVDAAPAPDSSGEQENALVPKVRISKEWRLVPYEEISIPAGTRVVSPEAERLTAIFPGIGESMFPLASCVAELALARQSSEPLEPLYMHPPVFVKPDQK